jgi:glycosyltransferase involved in cell wall biosynthesis
VNGLAGAPSVGLVHDYLLVLRGAERTFAAMADCWPEAPVYTTLFSEEGTGGRFAGHSVHTSFLRRTGVDQQRFRSLLPLFPRAVESLPVRGHDIVISSSSAFAHGVRPAEDAVHVCYCHSPFRYAWHELPLALDRTAAPMRPVLRRVLGRIRAWDLQAAGRVTHYVANSRITQQRIGDFYGREAPIIHPPVEVDRFSPGDPEDFFLVVCELVSHKRVEIALSAAARAGRPIKVVGDGPELGPLRERFAGRAELLGRVSDGALCRLYARAAALVVPNVEEFGIAAVEAQAAGRPVLAVAAGGTLETVVDGETGILVPTGTVDELAEAMRDVDFGAFRPERIARHARSFSVERFQQRLAGLVQRASGAAAASPQAAVSGA